MYEICAFYIAVCSHWVYLQHGVVVSRLVQLRHDPVKRLQNLIMRLNTDQGDFIQMRMEYLDPFAMDELQRADSITEPWSIQVIA